MKRIRRQPKAIKKVRGTKTMQQAPIKTYAPELRVQRAYQVAAEVMLLMHLEKKSVAVEILAQPECYGAVYPASDIKMIVVGVIGVIAAPLLRTDRAVQSDGVYDALLALDDPNCYMDRMAQHETRNMVTQVLHLMLTNWYAIESIAATLLAFTHDQQTIVGFSPSEYAFTD